MQTNRVSEQEQRDEGSQHEQENMHMSQRMPAHGQGPAIAGQDSEQELAGGKSRLSATPVCQPRAKQLQLCSSYLAEPSMVNQHACGTCVLSRVAQASATPYEHLVMHCNEQMAAFLLIPDA